MDNDNRKGEVLAVAALFFVLSWLTVGLRIYVRAVLMKTWGKDDSYMTACLFTFTVYLAFQITAAVHGTGRHRWELNDQDAKTALLFWYLCELLYTLVNCLLKFSIGYFYLRVAMSRWHIWTIKLLMAGAVFFGAVYFFLVMLQCRPISEFWNNHPASSKCLSRGPTLGITYALAACNAAADWALGTLPFFIVWDLEMKTRMKLLVAGILAFAAIGSTATVVRMFYIHTLMHGSDFLHATTDIAIWSTVEPGIGIAAGSIATLRPLFRHWLYRLGISSTPQNGRSRTYYHSGSGRERSKRRGYRRSLSPSDLVPTELRSTTSIEITGPQPIYQDTIIPSSTATVTTSDPVPEKPAPVGHIRQTTTFEQTTSEEQPALPPRVSLRHSFRNSFSRNSIITLGRFRLPD